MGCLECGCFFDTKNGHQWVCDKCSDKWIKIGEQVEKELKEKRGMKITDTVDCEECGGSGFSKAGTGYDSVCDNCGGQGEHPA